MGKLDLHIGNIDEKNDGLLIGWPDKDVLKSANDISNAAAQILSPLNVATENLIDTIRHPINNIFNPNVKNGSYIKLLKFVPATIALAITQALDKPLATVEKAIEYAINNNVERWIKSIKWISTKFLANVITNNWETSSKTAKWLWWIIEWAGDLAWSIVKSPLWLAQKWLRAVRNTNWYGTEAVANWGTNFVNEQRINSKDYLSLNLMNSESNPHYKEKETIAA